MSSFRPDEILTALSQAPQTSNRNTFKRGLEELDKIYNERRGKRVQTDKPSSFVHPASLSNSESQWIVPDVSPSRNMPVHDGRNDDSEDDAGDDDDDDDDDDTVGDTMYKLPDEAPVDAALDFERSFFDLLAIVYPLREEEEKDEEEEEEQVGTTVKAAWSMEEGDRSIRSAARAVTEQLGAYLDPNSAEHASTWRRTGSLSETKYSITFDVDNIQPAVKTETPCPLSIGYFATVVKQDAEGREAVYLPHASVIRRGGGNWTVDADEPSLADEAEKVGEGWPLHGASTSSDRPGL